MRIIVETSKFNKIVEMVNNVNYKIKEQEPTAINSQTICIRTSGKNEVSIIAMNQEMYLNILNPAEVVDDGMIIFQSATFLKTMKTISADRITLSSEGDKLKFIAPDGDCCAEINLLSERKFEKLPEFANRRQLTVVQSGVLSNCIKAVSSAIPTNAPQEGLNSCCLDFELCSLYFIGFDGYQLIRYTLNLEDEGTDLDFRDKLLVPTSAALAIAKILQKGKANVTLSFSNIKDKRYLVIEKEGVTMASRLKNFNYPNYEVLLTNESDLEFTFSQVELRKTMKSITGLGSSKDLLPVHFIFSGDTVELRIVTPDSTVSQKIKLMELIGEVMRFKLLAKSLKNVLPYLPDDIRIKVLKKGLVIIQSAHNNEYVFVTRTLS